MKVQLTHEFAVTADTFWRQLFLDAEYNRWLYVEKLRFPEYKVLEQREVDGVVHRKVRISPPQNAPAAVQKVVGDGFSYLELGTLELARGLYRFTTQPSTMPDKVKSGGELRCTDLGPKRCRRSLDFSVEVKLFGVGGIIEGFVAKSTQESYEKAATYTQEWITSKGL